MLTSGTARCLLIGAALALAGGSPAPAAALPGWLPDNFPEVDDAGSALCQRYFLDEEQAVSVLDAAIRTFQDESAWREYFHLASERIQEGAGLKLWPRRTPLNPVYHGERRYPGYTVLNVAFESIPGYWVTGNLYLPANVEGKVPAVLHTHGHSGNVIDPGGWARHGRFREEVQIRAATLALMGAVSLTIDMYGYGDSTIQVGYHAHRDHMAMTIQVWNAIRALDFLSGMDMVDTQHLAVTGHSGGGTQAFLLAALDPRVAVSVPVAMVSARFFGGCPCESGRPIHLGPDHFVNNAMIAAMAAPRPQLVISDGGDWTDRVPEVEFPFLREVYRDFGAEGNIENVHLPDEGHDYGPSKREAMYRFMARYLELDLAGVLDGNGKVDESRAVIEAPEIMRVFNVNHPVPDHSCRNSRDVEQALLKLQEIGE